MFCGNIFKYPVRNIDEVAYFIKNGTMITAYCIFSLWQDKELDENYLIHFF